MFGIENVFTFALIFFFIWIGNESEDCVSPDLVQIRQSSRVGYEVEIGFLHLCSTLSMMARPSRLLTHS